MSAKIIEFPGKKIKSLGKAIKSVVDPKSQQDTSLTPFRWVGFTSPPALNIQANVNKLDKLLVNHSDFDPPPRTA